MNRRNMLKTALALIVCSGLPLPRLLMAAWNKPAFRSDTLKEALIALAGSAEHTPSDLIVIKIPDTVLNGAVVQITATTTLENIESMSILVENNPNPLVAVFEMGPKMAGFISTRIKMAETSRVYVMVKANGVLYSAFQPVQVLVGGCY
ncbi:MAG: hypothetical protein A2V90_08085 [Gammaproteobacteria bacterium RBG_16_57_12]|nr:MAG: hypothetical protein A2V90_08085 [Gammaproteobacteria bacterium RBG_16_57_12]